MDILSDSESEAESNHKLTINDHYAKAFEYRKEREELTKLKEKYGSDYGEEDSEEDSEDAESEDEDGEELTPAMDAAILRTLARIKKKDPTIYEQGKNVFEEEREKLGETKPSTKTRQDKSKPVTIRQQALASALEPLSRSTSPEPRPLTHVEEQRALQRETIAAFQSGVKDDNSDDDDLLVPREKTKDELEKEEEEYQEFLKREVGEDLEGLITVDIDEGTGGIVKVDGEQGEAEAGEKRKGQKAKRKEKGQGKGKKSKEEEDQEFLLNYILNRGWVDRSTRRLPTYKEITGTDSSKGKKLNKEEDENGVEVEEFNDLSDAEFEEVADVFESSYNFRFEEPDAAAISRYPRQISSLVRREDTSRKEAREKRKARKDEEKQQKKEEVKRLKALKMKEIRQKLEKIGREGGVLGGDGKGKGKGKGLEGVEALQELDLEGDWDPEAHDRQMANIYSGLDEGLIDEELMDDDDDDDDEKPIWSEDIDIDDIVPEPSSSKKKKKKKKKANKDDDSDEGGVDINDMDADVQRDGQDIDEEEWDGTEEMRKRKLDEYMDEIYGLEFNDMVGDLPTRFHYTKVAPQSYALSPVDILLGTDQELNQYLSIKKYAPYRNSKQNNWDKGRAERLKELKEKVKERAQRGGIVHTTRARGEETEKPKKRKGKKERMKEKTALVEGEGGDPDGADAEHSEPAASNNKGTKRKVQGFEEEGSSALREDSAPRTKKKKRRHK